MARILNIPIRFRFIKVPVRWEILTIRGERRAIGEIGISAQSPHGANLSELDGWRYREELFKLPQTDESLLRFLNQVGLWRSHPSKLIRLFQGLGIQQEDIALDTLWAFREGLKEGLIDRRGFAELYARPQPTPSTFVEWLSQTRDYNLFDLAFEISKVPSGVVTVTDAYHMLRATVYADLVRGLRFKSCQRKDCGNPFAIESKHKRKYCTQYCAHLESVRKQRWKEKQKKKKRIRAERKQQSNAKK